MSYGMLAGILVTLSLFLLSLESLTAPKSSTSGRGFILLYGLGVVFWIGLAIAINLVSLVVISSLQIMFLLLFNSVGVSEK